MGKIKLILGTSILLSISVQSKAVLVTVGSLTTETDGSSIIISDSLNNREWLRWDILADLTYSQTQAFTSYSDFTIADQFDAAKFMEASGGNGGACTDPLNNTSVSPCTILPTFSVFGDNHEVSDDIVWFLSTDQDSEQGGQVGTISQQYGDVIPLGYVGFLSINWESPNTILDTDDYSSIGRFSDSTISWLMYRDIPDPCSPFPGGGATDGCFPGPGEFPGGGVSAVPAPAAVWLFGTGLIGLIGFTKRRKAA